MGSVTFSIYSWETHDYFLGRQNLQATYKVLTIYESVMRHSLDEAFITVACNANLGVLVVLD